jgi:hypothetical protein
MPFRDHQHGRDQSRDDRWTGRDDPATAQLIPQCRRDLEDIGCGQINRQQPRRQLAAMSRCKHLEAELLTRSIELLTSG